MRSVSVFNDPMDTKTLSTNFRELSPPNADGPTQTGSGSNFPAAKLVEIFEPNQWENFTEEWAISIKPAYVNVIRWSAAFER